MTVVEQKKSKVEEGFNPFKIAIKKKVIILGTAPSCKDAPFGNPDFDVWGVAHCCFLKEVSRLDAIFEIHTKDIWEKDNAPFHRFPNAVLFLQEKDAKFANSQAYPLKEIRDIYKVNKGFEYEADYLSSSLPYMVAMAIENGYEEIHVYGIHLLMDEEYFYQRPCLEYYLGIARGKGIKVYVHPAADILKFNYLYGWQDMTDQTRKIRDRINEFNTRMANLQTQLNQGTAQLQAQINQLQGAKEDAMYFLRTFGGESKKNDVIF